MCSGCFSVIENDSTEIFDAITIDPDFRGDLIEEMSREMENYYEHDELNGIQHLYSCFDCIAPNNDDRDNDILDFETHDNERVFTSRLTRNTTNNSSKHGMYACELDFDLATNYALLFPQANFGSIDIDSLKLHPDLVSATATTEEDFFLIC